MMQCLKYPLNHTTVRRLLCTLTIPSLNLLPSTAAYIQSLNACVASKSLRLGQEIHQHILKNSPIIEDSIILEKLTRLYLEFGKIRHARKLFDEIPGPGVIVWNSMIRAYAWRGPFEEAIDLYKRMIGSGVLPTKFTFPFVLKACSGLCDGDEGEKIHGRVVKAGLELDGFVATALVDLYAKCGDLDDASEVFCMMCWRDVVAWNAMIAGFSLQGHCDETMWLVKVMQKSGVNPNSSTVVSVLPMVALTGALNRGKEIHGYCVRRNFNADVTVGTGLLDMYGKCGGLSYARRVFERLMVANEVTWSAMIGAYAISEHMKEALELYDHVLVTCMKKPSPVILGGALRACAKLIDTSRGRRIHCQTLKLGYASDLIVGNTLLSMYAKCGALDDATKYFNEMNLKDTVSYGAIISGCVQNGNSRQALDFFRSMNSSGINPEIATMLGILPACSHLAAHLHGTCAHGNAIVRGFTGDTAICNALIDMYVKCGKVGIARQIFDTMSNRGYNLME
ncbi:hypothetical protein Droror1_Dr00001659 [Drosera rotundifolia]